MVHVVPMVLLQIVRHFAAENTLAVVFRVAELLKVSAGRRPTGQAFAVTNLLDVPQTRRNSAIAVRVEPIKVHAHIGVITGAAIHGISDCL